MVFALHLTRPLPSGSCSMLVLPSFTNDGIMVSMSIESRMLAISSLVTENKDSEATNGHGCDGVTLRTDRDEEYPIVLGDVM